MISSSARDGERYKSPSPVRAKDCRPRSLTPGTKEILAYRAEQEAKMTRKSSPPVLPPTFDMFADNEEEKKRHSSGSSVDSIEKLRLQALETLKSRAMEHKSPRGRQAASYKGGASEDEYVERKVKKSKKKRDKSPNAREILEALVSPKMKRSKRSNSSNSESDRRKKKKKHKKKSSSDSCSDSESSNSNSDLKKAWEEIKMKWEKKLKKKKTSKSDSD